MTTTKSPKVAKRPPVLAKKPKRKSFLRELAAEMNRLTGKIWDPGYLSNLVTGCKLNKGLMEDGTLDKAIRNLAARGIRQAA
jgi:hypothetical protein